MSIAINGMEMPISCPHCPCSDDESRFCRAANKYIPMLGKPEFCPLVTIEERKNGKWINDRLVSTNGGTYGVRRCSECEAYYQDVGYGWNYCPNCGADMRGREDG